MIWQAKRLCAFTSIGPEACAHPHLIRKVNNYLLCAKIGSGSSSAVYLATDELSQRRYAVKRIRIRELAKSSNGLAQLEREIRLMRLLKHPNILRLVEVLYASADAEAFLVLEYADSGSVGDLVERGVALPHAAVFSIVKQIATAIQYLHETGYIHQDVKPYNILLDSSGRAVLADFGVGHSFHSAGMVVGSPAYQAPEALDDSYASDEDSLEEPQKEDVWALGVTLYQLLFGWLPFAGSTLFEIVNDIRSHPLEIPRGADPRVAQLLRGMLTVDPMSRYGVADLLRHPLVRDAAYRAAGLPPAPPRAAREGRVVAVAADVCHDGWSFAACRLPGQRRFSFGRQGRPRAGSDDGYRRSCDVVAPPFFQALV
jgi:serine/threonine-protein kinase 11